MLHDEPEGDECIVCYMLSDRRTVCGHALCLPCARAWHAKKQCCPMCRESMMLRATSGSDDCCHDARVVVIDWTAATAHAGVTLKKEGEGEGVAVRVCKINEADAAYAAGLRRGDVIVEMNELPCVTHEWAARALDLAARHRAPVQCTIAAPRRRTVLFPSIVSLAPREWRRGGIVRLASATEASTPLVGAAQRSGASARMRLL